MRRSKDNRLQAGVLEGFRIACVVRKAVGLGKFLAGWMRLGGANDLDIVRRFLQHGGHLLTPPAEANHRDFDGSGFIHFKISTCSSPMRCFCSPQLRAKVVLVEVQKAVWSPARTPGER